MSPQEQKKAALEFSRRWQGRGDEKQDTQTFWTDLFQSVFGVENAIRHLRFEKRVKLEDSTRYIDVYIPDTKVIVEQKGKHIDLSKAEHQSGGASLTPYNQARRYDNNLPASEKARWIICCNFERFEIHDMDSPLAEPEVILLENLEKDFQKLSFVADVNVDYIRKEEQISVKAGQLVGRLYDLILPQYDDPTNPDTLKSLNQLCVRLVFCLYAEDTGLFGEKDKFYTYLSTFRTGQFRKGLIELFKVFDTPYEERDKYMDPELAAFPYIKGGIFTEEIEIPQFTDEIIDHLLHKASLEVDWSEISPTVFGAVFESTLNPETRHSGGMHYTSVENIHKVIGPLFLDDLQQELDGICAIAVRSKRDKALMEYQEKLSRLTFLDPACGSGNFLTETYLSIRRLENRVLEAMGTEGMLWLGEEFSPIKVKIGQFYGIEINDFAVAVARTALWIAESQTMKETEHIVGRPIEYFPLKENPNIVEGNALRMDWNEVVPAAELNYIMGNPPFVGAYLMSPEQHDDLIFVLGSKWKNIGELDYVSGWYKKSCDYMRHGGQHISAALVSTNSITQGEQVANLWMPLVTDGLIINFAWRTFRWDSEAALKAHVYCVVVGFSMTERLKEKIIFDGDRTVSACHINAYLTDGPDMFITSRSKPICNVPGIRKGNQPTEGGNLILTEEEKNAIISANPGIERFIKKLTGAKEYINNKFRYCLWLKDATPSDLRTYPEIRSRIQAVKEMRLKSNDQGTRKLADAPHLFREVNNPESYIVVPSHSSERRQYIPMGFLRDDVIPTNAVLIIPEAGVYHLGVLTSSIHMSWMRAVCGRLEMRYRYSKDVVYNNFPWPTPTAAQKEKIEKTAQAILDVRNLYPECSLADLYDEVTMPPELRKAHQANDKAVMEAYGFDPSVSESRIVAELFKMYRELSQSR